MNDKVVLVFLVALSLTNALNVPSGFELVDKKYMVAKTTVTFFEAFVTCRGQGYEMATVSSEEENSLLKTLVEPNVNYWIGGINYDPIFDGDWSWIDSKAKINFTNWASLEPKRGNGVNGIYFKSGLWYANPISGSYRFICAV